MYSAHKGCDATVKALLSWGSRPNRIDDYGNTAQVAAIHAGVSSTIDILSPVTKVGLGKALAQLAQDQV